jgi:plasmid stability protein
MASITLKDIPEDIHAQLIREARANHRSLNGEVLRRIELSFDLESALNSQRDAQWIKEAIESGPEEPLSRKKFDAAVKRGLDQAAQKSKAA